LKVKIRSFSKTDSYPRLIFSSNFPSGILISPENQLAKTSVLFGNKYSRSTFSLLSIKPIKETSIEFYTPEYDLVLTSSEKENFLQLYTPMNTNAIAIEPMTGVSDSFNNKIGLKELFPGKNYDIEWVIVVKIKTN